MPAAADVAWAAKALSVKDAAAVVAAVAASPGPPASLPLALLSQPSPDKRIGMDGPSVRRGIVRMAIAMRQ